MSRSWLFVGAKVVCVDAGHMQDALAEGREYTVASVQREAGLFHGDFGVDWLTVRLEEVEHPQDPHFGFNAKRFRPFVHDTTDTVEKLKQGMRDAVRGGELVPT